MPYLRGKAVGIRTNDKEFCARHPNLISKAEEIENGLGDYHGQARGTYEDFQLSQG